MEHYEQVLRRHLRNHTTFTKPSNISKIAVTAPLCGRNNAEKYLEALWIKKLKNSGVF